MKKHSIAQGRSAPKIKNYSYKQISCCTYFLQILTNVHFCIIFNPLFKSFREYSFIIIALLAAGGVGYYVKIVRPKQQAEDDEDFEDDGYGEGFDPDEAYGGTEYLSEDDFEDRINDEQEDSE